MAAKQILYLPWCSHPDLLGRYKERFFERKRQRQDGYLGSRNSIPGWDQYPSLSFFAVKYDLWPIL